MRTFKAVMATLVALLVTGALADGTASAQQSDNANCAAGQPRPGRPGDTGGGQPSGRPVEYPPGQCNLLLSRGAAARGETVNASGSGFQPGETVTLSVGNQHVKSMSADPNGAFATDFVVPNDAPIGRTEVQAKGGAQVLSAAFEVTGAAGSDRSRAAETAAAASTAGSTLPRTGAVIGGTAVAGIALVGVGAVLVMTARRRREAVPA